MLTIDVVSFDEAPAPLPNHYSIRVAVADEVIPQDGISPAADICPTPLVFSDHVVYERPARREAEIRQVVVKGQKYIQNIK